MSDMLLQAIREQPDDDLVRLACADWLEEQGQADRAELIRRQIDLHLLPESDPRAVPLLARAETLLAEHEKAWLGPWADRLVRWTFSRGFLDSVVLEPETFLRHGEELFHHHPVREVQFVTADGVPCGPEWVDELAASPSFAQVRSLDASGGDPPAGPMWCRVLARSPHLKRLEELNFASNWRAGSIFTDCEAFAELCQADHLRGLRVLSLAAPMAPAAPGDEVLASIVRAPFAARLQTLNLSGLGLTDEGIRTLASCRALAHLRYLELAWCEQLSREGIQALLHSRYLRSIEELSLGGDIDVSALARSPRLGQLRELTLNTNTNRFFRTFPSAGWADLARSAHVGRLRRLHLFYALLNEEGAAGLFQTPGLLRLHALTMMGMQGSGDVLAGLLATSPALAELTSLELASCNITVAGMKPLLAAPFVRQLSLFCVASNRILSRGVQTILRSGLAGGNLIELHLHHCQLQPGTLRRLLGWRGLAHVEKLELGSNTFDVETMNALLASPCARRLTCLHLASGPIPADALSALAHDTALPRLRTLTIPADASEHTRERLRQRFGPRLTSDSPI